MKSLLVLEDNSDCIEIYKDILKSLYKLDLIDNLLDLEKIINSESSYHGMIADMYLKDGSFLDWITANNSFILEKVPTIIVSSVDDIQILRTAYEWGAEDYITKPFKTNELIVKLERMLNRGVGPDLKFKGDNFLEGLTLIENKIFNSIMEKKGEAISREELFKNVWKKVQVSSKTLDVHLSNLRKKLHQTDWQIESKDSGWRMVKK